MHRAISHYIKKKAAKINKEKSEDYINQTFDLIESEIDLVKRTEIKKFRIKKLREKINDKSN